MDPLQLFVTIIELAPSLVGLVVLAYVLFQQESRESERVDKLIDRVTRLAYRCGQQDAKNDNDGRASDTPEERDQ